MSFDIELQRNAFINAAANFLVRKMNNGEVNLQRLSAMDRELFNRAKAKEVSRQPSSRMRLSGGA